MISLDVNGMGREPAAVAAVKEGRLSEEITPVSKTGRDGGSIVEQDEGIRPGTTADRLARLPAAFSPDGTITAGSASQLSDGGCAVVVTAGLFTSLACAAVISEMLVAGLLAHRRNGFFVFKDGYEYVLVLVVISLALAILGPGHWSVDVAAGIEVTGWAGGSVALGVAVASTAGMLAAFWRPRAETTNSPEAASTP